MTANQVANAMNVETERHNETVETETERHNRALEDLTAEANRIQERKDDHENTYKMESLRIQEEYNKAYLEWQTAQGQRKLELEADMNRIKDYEAVTEAEFKNYHAMYEQEMADIQQQIADEQERTNKAREDIEQVRNDLTAKYNEYQNTYWNQSIGLGQYKAVIDLQRNAQTYELGLLGVDRDLAALKRDAAQMQMQKEMLPWQKASILLNGTGSILSGMGKAFSPSLPFLLNPWR